MGGIGYSGDFRGHFLDHARRAGCCSGVLGIADRGTGGCGAAAAASVADAKGADIESKAGHDSACGGYGVPVLWSAIVSAGLAMLVPGLRGGEGIGGAN